MRLQRYDFTSLNSARVIYFWPARQYAFVTKLLVILCLSNCNPGLIAPPTDVDVTKVESRMATVQWTNPGDDPAMKSATSSQLRYSNQEGTWDVKTTTLTTSHTLTGLTPYTNYTVKVLLVDSAGRGLWSAELEFTTDLEGQSADIELVGHLDHLTLLEWSSHASLYCRYCQTWTGRWGRLTHIIKTNISVAELHRASAVMPRIEHEITLNSLFASLKLASCWWLDCYESVLVEA